MQYLRIDSRITSQLFGVELIALAITVSNRPDLSSIRHQHFMPKLP